MLCVQEAADVRGAVGSARGRLMDGAGFDAWVREWRTRRGALRSLIAVGTALGAPHAARAGVPTCDANGSRCDPATLNTCCTGTCKKHKGKFRCAPAGKAYGCTKKQDGCHGAPPTGCPDNLAGTGCVAGNKGKPLCIVGDAKCAPCKRDADCAFGAGPTARCVKRCAACKKNQGINSACVVPAPPPP